MKNAVLHFQEKRFTYALYINPLHTLLYIIAFYSLHCAKKYISIVMSIVIVYRVINYCLTEVFVSPSHYYFYENWIYTIYVMNNPYWNTFTQENEYSDVCGIMDYQVLFVYRQIRSNLHIFDKWKYLSTHILIISHICIEISEM